MNSFRPQCWDTAVNKPLNLPQGTYQENEEAGIKQIAQLDELK